MPLVEVLESPFSRPLRGSWKTWNVNDPGVALVPGPKDSQ